MKEINNFFFKKHFYFCIFQYLVILTVHVFFKCATFAYFNCIYSYSGNWANFKVEYILTIAHCVRLYPYVCVTLLQFLSSLGCRRDN